MTTLAITARDGAARTGILRTMHGDIRLPAFMPVGTHATVKGLMPAEVRATGADILLCNGYHLALRPGADAVERAGGLHAMMRWDGPILTDSGGYQMVSLSSMAALDDDGAEFVSPYDGKRLRMSPEGAVEVQARLGADIIMCLDQPVAFGSSPEEASTATARTHRWAERCRAVHPGTGLLLFGIAQGGFDRDLRRQSAEVVSSLGFDGVAIGGLALGEPPPVLAAMAAAALEAIPEDVPRYVMGLGSDIELLTLIGLGVDMFDCVLPTRLARTGTAVTDEGRMVLRRPRHRDEHIPLEDGCPCPACAGGFTRSYLRHLLGADEMLGYRLLSAHNLTHLGRLMSGARAAIQAGTFAAYCQARRRALGSVSVGRDLQASGRTGGAYTSPP